VTDPFDALRRTDDAAPPRATFVAELADRLRAELGIREGDKEPVLMRTAMGDMPVHGNVPSALLDVIEDQGYAVLENALSADEVGAVREGLAPYLGHGPFGRNDFEGFRTKRVYSLPAKSRAFDRLIEDERVLDVAGALLGANFLLTAALAINLGPDETAQDLHYDEAFYYGLPRPRRPLSLSTLWAIDDFTADNGGTLIAPRSQHWGDGPPDPSAELVPLEMPAGSVAIYPGTLWHAGGANTTGRFRLGISIQYVVAWARQQESYLLAVPPDTVRELSPRLRQLLGYSIHPPFMGHVDGRHPEKTLG
jgi:ectoine hydroxylase-related dioxygenase (phytanoyl-CoA dioxygenase family)